MRLDDLNESFGELDIIRGRIRELKRAQAIFDIRAATVTLIFELKDGTGVVQSGRAVYRALPQGLISQQEVLRRKLAAAARSQSRGSPIESVVDQVRMCETIGPNAIRILTNPSEMVLASIRWADITY